MQGFPDLGTSVVMRSGDTIETFFGKLGPVVVSVNHLTNTPVIVTLKVWVCKDAGVNSIMCV